MSLKNDVKLIDLNSCDSCWNIYIIGKTFKTQHAKAISLNMDGRLLFFSMDMNIVPCILFLITQITDGEVNHTPFSAEIAERSGECSIMSLMTQKLHPKASICVT